MGKPAQERLIRKLDLERFLSEIKANPSPNASLEQYTISTRVAADLLYLAAYVNGDIIGKSVLDLGCGTGRLALGAAFLGARLVVGVDVDKAAVALALEGTRSHALRGKTDWVAGDIDAISCRFDTVLQNPPFGVQKRCADRRFLEKALEVGCSIYSLHNHPQRDERLIQWLKGNQGMLVQVEASPFMVRFVEARGGTVSVAYALLMTIPRMFTFHTKFRHDFVVDLYVIKRKD